MVKVLVTGLSGMVGPALVKELHRKGGDVTIKAACRDSDALKKLQLPESVESLAIDYESDESLQNAFKGVQVAVLFAKPGIRDRDVSLRREIELARSAGVTTIITVTAIAVDCTESLFGKSFGHWDQFMKSELASNHVIDIRPGFFTENFFGQAKSIKEQNMFFLNLGPDGVYACVAVQDIAKLIASLVLMQKDSDTHKYAGKVFNQTGPKMSLKELSEAISLGLGRTVSGVDVPTKDFIQAMTSAGVPEFVAVAVADCNEWTGRHVFDKFADQWNNENVFENITGEKQITVQQWFQALANAFSLQK